MAGGRFRELLRKYGKVALGVHFSVSAASITGLYIAINNNVDVESIFEKIGMPGLGKEPKEDEIPKQPSSNTEITTIYTDASSDGFIMEQPVKNDVKKERNRTTELVASSGGALALAVLLNKALFPVRVPITFALTPPVARFLARRNIIKNNV
ncbi:PREDICTED: uncharacterized protein LOC109211672 [Olea europaea subsp. europaea]|uniref:PREDICTED: uncharacterized protein LOC109211672 n=1 Tax=Olea europaea subsp. europaea TaxID=158383 RepID=A0A8S0R8W7_OLEEU|nr:PREDICTED: uncharacterized protein LOC109211672 [Olea europaea subsp. europaea]